MDIPTVVSVKSSVELIKISLPFDSWKIVFEYLNDENSEGGFGLILPCRTINKNFSKMVLECIRAVKITINYFQEGCRGDSSCSILKRQKINDVICRCKGLRSLHILINVHNDSDLGHLVYGDDGLGYDKVIERLQQVGDNCKSIEELVLEAEFIFHTSENLPTFPTLRKLFLKDFFILPPSHMQNLMNLEAFEGPISHLWAHAISIVPNLKELKWGSATVYNQDMIYFCNRSKENSICNTLEVFSISRCDGLKVNELTDDGLYLVLDTFPNLRAIEIQGLNLSLRAASIPQKLGTLTQLKILKLNDTSVVSGAAYVVNFDSIYEWLELSLPYLPKSLEVIGILDCREYDTNNSINGVKSRIESKFYDTLPILREMKVTFDIGLDD
jgi:hypothetical protein